MIFSILFFIILAAVLSYLYVTNFMLLRNEKNTRIMTKANVKLERLLEYLDGMAGGVSPSDIPRIRESRQTAKKYRIDEEKVIFEVEEERDA